ncbi:MAG: glycosyltransferase family 4 protein [Caulobacteraceae bacterium]
MLPQNFTLLQVTPALDGGGVETLTVDMATAVARAGGRSLVASRGGRLEDALAWGGAELIRLPVQTRNPLKMLGNARSLESIIEEEKVSLVHVRSRAPAFSALAAARNMGTPVVTSYHGIDSARSEAKRWYNAVMTRGDRVIANSRYTRDHIFAQHKVRPDKVVLIPEGVDVAAFDPRYVERDKVTDLRASWLPDDGRAVVLVAARLTSWKGHKLIIEAIARGGLAARARLVFVGEGAESALGRELVKTAAAAGVTLTLAGAAKNMPAVFLAADIVAAPSTEPESFGRTVAEAGAMARLVIASSLGGVAETIIDGETGFLAPAGDAQAWAAALARVLDMEQEARVAMGVAAWTRIREHYSIQRMCEATFDLYYELSEKA